MNRTEYDEGGRGNRVRGGEGEGEKEKGKGEEKEQGRGLLIQMGERTTTTTTWMGQKSKSKRGIAPAIREYRSLEATYAFLWARGFEFESPIQTWPASHALTDRTERLEENNVLKSNQRHEIKSTS